MAGDSPCSSDGIRPFSLEFDPDIFNRLPSPHAVDHRKDPLFELRGCYGHRDAVVTFMDSPPPRIAGLVNRGGTGPAADTIRSSFGFMQERRATCSDFPNRDEGQTVDAV